jgi:ADP-ribose pyrophosphatase
MFAFCSLQVKEQPFDISSGAGSEFARVDYYFGHCSYSNGSPDKWPLVACYNEFMYKKWRTLSQKQLLAHPRLNVYEDKVLLPGGEETTYIHFGHHHDAAMVIAQRHDGKILIQKEYSYPMNEWLFQFPGGAIEKGETREQGALREMAEEASITGALKELGWFYLDNRRRQDKMYVFFATDLNPAEAKKDLEEEFETFWFTPDEINKLIQRGSITNYSALAAWSLYRSID